jgi:hypothetical protein
MLPLIFQKFSIVSDGWSELLWSLRFTPIEVTTSYKTSVLTSPLLHTDKACQANTILQVEITASRVLSTPTARTRHNLKPKNWSCICNSETLDVSTHTKDLFRTGGSPLERQLSSCWTFASLQPSTHPRLCLICNRRSYYQLQKKILQCLHFNSCTHL